MKKILSIALALLLIFTLVACNSAPKEWSRGKVVDNVYTSEFAGIKLTPPDSNWIYYSDEQIAQLMNLTTQMDIFSDEQKAQMELAKQQTIYDAVLANSTSGSNINVVYENLEQNPVAKDLDAKGYADLLISQIKQMQGTNIGEKFEKTVAGQKYVCIEGSISSYGMTMNQRYLLRKIGNYILAITITQGPQSTDSLDSLETIITKK